GWQQLQERPAGVELPLLLVLHDLSDAAFRQGEPALRRLVANGVHLLFCGVPTPTANPSPVNSVLPVASVGGDRLYNRLPRLAILLDRSRLQYLPFRPTVDGAVPDLTRQSAEPLAGTGEAHQVAFVRALCAELNIPVSGSQLTDLKASPSWIETEIHAGF